MKWLPTLRSCSIKMRWKSARTTVSHRAVNLDRELANIWLGFPPNKHDWYFYFVRGDAEASGLTWRMLFQAGMKVLETFTTLFPSRLRNKPTIVLRKNPSVVCCIIVTFRENYYKNKHQQNFRNLIQHFPRSGFDTMKWLRKVLSPLFGGRNFSPATFSEDVNSLQQYI